jgi:hypothetical protein
MRVIVVRAIAIGLVTACIVAAYVYGLRVGRAESVSGFGNVLDQVQADLSLNKLQRLQELEKYLARGCAEEALIKVRIDIGLEMSLLSSFYKKHKGTWVVENVEKRDPTLSARLEKFEEPATSWTEPQCKK